MEVRPMADTNLPTADAERKASWRSGLKIHPAAQLFPLMPPDELKALTEDINKNGLHNPVVIWRDLLLDVRNRLDAWSWPGGRS
jgi:hypothetical protein